MTLIPNLRVAAIVTVIVALVAFVIKELWTKPEPPPWFIVLGRSVDALGPFFRSWTIRFAAFVAWLPFALDYIVANFAALAPYLPTGKQAAILHVIGLIIFALRLRTVKPLQDR
jgi:hypothetical protein